MQLTGFTDLNKWTVAEDKVLYIDDDCKLMFWGDEHMIWKYNEKNNWPTVYGNKLILEHKIFSTL